MAKASSVYEFRVRREDLRSAEFLLTGESSSIELEPGQVLMAVDAFALTANNITYAIAGDSIGYWNFFPAPDGWGIVPVWGYTTVERSQHPDLSPGERFYGFFPMSTLPSCSAHQCDEFRI